MSSRVRGYAQPPFLPAQCSAAEAPHRLPVAGHIAGDRKLRGRAIGKDDGRAMRFQASPPALEAEDIEFKYQSLAGTHAFVVRQPMLLVFGCNQIEDTGLFDTVPIGCVDHSQHLRHSCAAGGHPVPRL